MIINLRHILITLGLCLLGGFLAGAWLITTILLAVRL